ncbi:hypothetical protein lerEdw1_000581 [Lerista edwardsae]|nr:hypothetical protein lerEdw1_000581 [Lerista edwardsae]
MLLGLHLAISLAIAEGSVQDVNLGDTYSYYMIQGLQPGTEYVISINPVFGAIEGPIVTAKATTLSSSAVQILKAADITINSALVSWNSVPGATGYRVTWGPTPEFFGRDRPRQLALGSSTTTYHLQNLAHNTEYVISLYVLFGSVEGPGITITARTSPLGYVSNFKVTSFTSTSISLSWSAVPAATKYKIAWKPVAGEKEKEAAESQFLDSRVLVYRLENLLPDTRYVIGIRAVFGVSAGKEVTLTHETFCSRFKADIAFLVDESSSIGQSNFLKMKEFLFRIVSYFPRIGPEGTQPNPDFSKLFCLQIAVAQYSDEPRTEFYFNQHKDRNGVLKALKRLRYAGGNTKTGRGIGYVLKELFQSSKGMRPTLPRTLILLTDGPSQDDVIPPAKVAHLLGIRMIVVGILGADPEELKRILLHQNLHHLFYVRTFDDLPQIIRELIETICFGSQQVSALPQHSIFLLLFVSTRPSLECPVEDLEC